LSTRKIGDRTEAVAWTVYGPDGAKVASGEIPAGKETAISTAVPRPGTYVLLVNAGFNAARLTLLNAHAALAARRLNLIGSGGPLYFAVPAGTRQFKLSLGSDAPGETAAFVLRDGAGKEVYLGATTEVRELTPTIEVAPDQAGQVWCLTYGAAPTGVLEDVRIGIEGLPAYFSHDPSRLVQPAPGK
ncbi:MAG: hypothetical protein HUU35_15370, partial [Armatimonadetes bacterium]|nr:hypothetical protein [Armatimonadota bacterium]